MTALMLDDDNNITRVTKHMDGSLPMNYGPKHTRFHQAYLTTQQRTRTMFSAPQRTRLSLIAVQTHRLMKTPQPRTPSNLA